MQVTGKNEVRQLLSRIDAHQENRPARSRRTAQGQTLVHQDSVRLSQKAKEVLEFSRQARSVDDMRSDKTAELRLKMEQGIYQIDGKKIAFKMIRESILNQIL